MKKLFLSIFVLFLMFCCTSCNLMNNTACANGHDFEKATFENPKTCKVCGKTEGEKLTNDFNQLTKALDDLSDLNFTCDNVPFYLLMINDPEMPLCKIEKDGDENLLTGTVDRETAYVYLLKEENRLIAASRSEGYEEWDTVILDKEEENYGQSFELFFNQMEIPFFIPDEEDFELKDGLWVGDTNKITEKYSSVFTFYFSFDDDIEIIRYDIKLNNNGEVDTIYFEFGDAYYSIKANYKFSKIGTTKITNKPEIEEAK